MFQLIPFSILKHQINKIFYHVFYGILSLVITSSLLAWIIVPFVPSYASILPDEDVTKFLINTGLPPFTIALAALLIMAFLILLIHKKRLMRKIMECNREILSAHSERLSKVFLMYLITALVLGAVIAVFGFSILTPKPILEQRLTMEVNSATEDVKFPFKVEESKSYSMDLAFTAKGVLADLQIYSENSTLIYQNTCEQFKMASTLNLERGNYIFVVAFLKDPITMVEKLKPKGYKADKIEQLKHIYDMNDPMKCYPISFSVIIK